VAFPPDGTLLATADALGHIELLDAATGRPVRALGQHLGCARCLDFSPDGARLASCGDDRRVRVWNVAGGTLEGQFLAHADRIWCVQFASDGQRLLTASRDQTCTLWELAGPQPYRRLAVPQGSAHRAVFTPHGRTLAVSTIKETVALVEDPSRSAPEVLPVRAIANGELAFAPDGRRLAVPDAGGRILVWDRVAKREVMVLVPRELPDPKTLPEWFDPRTVTGLAFAHGGQRLAAVYRNSTLRVWDLADGRELACEELPGGAPFALAVSPDGALIAVGGDGGYRLWDVARNRWQGGPLFTLSLTCLSFSADGRTLAVGGQDLTIKLVDPLTGAVKATLLGHEMRIISVAFSPDGRTLASSSDDGTVRLWHAATGQQLFTLAEYPRQTHLSVSFSADGQVLAVAEHLPKQATNVALWSADR
jgi:hypothetical protein